MTDDHWVDVTTVTSLYTIMMDVSTGVRYVTATRAGFEFPYPIRLPDDIHDDAAIWRLVEGRTP